MVAARDRSAPRTLELQRADNAAVAQITRLVRALALVPTSPAVAVQACLLAHHLEDTAARDSAWDWLQKTVTSFPPDPADAAHQLEKCLTAASYLRIAAVIGRIGTIDDFKPRQYVEYARQRQWFDSARLAAEVALLTEELVAGGEARQYLRAHIDEWRLEADWLSVMQAYAGLGETVTVQEMARLVADADRLGTVGGSQIEAACWGLLALRNLDSATACTTLSRLAGKVIDTLQTEENSLRAVADLQTLLYLASAPISPEEFARCTAIISEASTSSILRNVVIEDGKAVIDLVEASGALGERDYISMEELALAAYTLATCGFQSLTGVPSNQASLLKNALDTAAKLGSGQVIIPAWELQVYNLTVAVVAAGIVFGWTFWTSGGVLTPKQDWLAIAQSMAVPEGVVLLAGAIGWVTRGRVLTGLITWITDMVGHKVESPTVTGGWKQNG